MTNYEKLNISEYQDVLITNSYGEIVFFDMANLKMFDLRPEDILGHKVTSLYKDFNENESTIMKVLKDGIPICNYKQSLKTKKNNIVYQIGSTFPIMARKNIIGAVEFSKYLYKEDTISLSKTHSEHRVYRKNDTIYLIDDIVAANPKMLEIKEKIRRVAKTNSSVLIYGETGTGKEMLAQSIHNLSARYDNKFVSQNCAAIPDTLFESTFFGTVKGSFTGAEDKKGLFEEAQGGTLFIDEINSLSSVMQVKLLKAIEEKRIKRIGSTKNINLDLRIIAALNENPMALVRTGRLREDLFYRLAVVQFNIPSLRVRKEEIILLINNYINYYNRLMNKNVAGISSELKEIVLSYDWPGNIRELKNMIESAFNNEPGEYIQKKDIPEYIKGTDIKNEFSLVDEKINLKRYLEEYEKNIIIQKLKESEGNMAEAARQMMLSRQSLKYKIEKYNIKIL